MQEPSHAKTFESVRVPVSPAWLLATTASQVPAREGSPAGVGTCPGTTQGKDSTSSSDTREP